ncbi:metal-dependent hydrolase [Candidatus Woesearchaeota archaeon]|nr:metal-dependent hydrolase [Candidatus Woesearchaeota archaeon]
MATFEKHIELGFGVSIVVLAILWGILGINIFEMNTLISGFVTTIIFSVLPDIDNKNAKISRYLHVMFIVSIIGLFWKTFSINISTITAFLMLIGLELYHWNYAKDDKTHRQFPHTFTFGILTSIFLYVITFSGIATLLGFLALSSHLLIDGHGTEAWKKDQKIWLRLFSFFTRRA